LTEKEISLEIKKPELLVLLVFLSLVLFLDTGVTLKTPISFGDEGFHARISQWIAQEKDYFAWIPFIGKEAHRGFGRVPLWNLTGAGFYLILGFNDIIGKLLPPIIAFFTGLSVYLLVKKLYNKEIGFISSVVSVSIPSFVTYSVLLYTDVMLVFYSSLSTFTLLLALKNDSKKYLLLSGVFASFSFLTKVSGMASYAIFGVIILHELIKNKKLQPLIKKYSPVILILILVPSAFFLRSLYYYKTPICYVPVPFFSQDGCNKEKIESEYKFPARTEEVGTEVGVFKMGVMNYFTFAYGRIWLFVFGMISGMVLMFTKKDKIDVLILLVILGLTTILIQSRIYTRAEDTARYTLIFIPVMSVIHCSKIFYGNI